MALTSVPVSQTLAIKQQNESPAKQSQATHIEQNARDYNELMDEYSLHQLIIRRGVLLDTTPEFNSFKRTFLQKWGQISYILMLVEKLLKNADIEMAYIDGRKIAQLCYTTEIDLSSKPSEEDLFNCITNKDEVAQRIKVPSLMYKGHSGPVLAATNIQKNWRMHKARVAYTYLRFLISKATKIQKAFRLYVF